MKRFNALMLIGLFYVSTQENGSISKDKLHQLQSNLIKIETSLTTPYSSPTLEQLLLSLRTFNSIITNLFNEGDSFQVRPPKLFYTSLQNLEQHLLEYRKQKQPPEEEIVVHNTLRFLKKIRKQKEKKCLIS